MTDLTLIPITDTAPEPFVPAPSRWPEPPVTLLQRTPLPEAEEVDWEQWDSAVRWHDSKCGDL